MEGVAKSNGFCEVIDKDGVAAASRDKTQVQRLKRVFGVDMETYRHCGGTVSQIHRQRGHSNGRFQERRMSGVGWFCLSYVESFV